MSDERGDSEHEEVEQSQPLLAAVDALAPAFASSGLDEMEVEVGDLSVRLARPRATVMATAQAVAAPAAGQAAASVQQAEPAQATSETEASGMGFVTAPLTGIWYSAPSPGARPYMQEGDEVAVGQVVGLIEAMKLFNEIKSDVAGTVTRMLVETGTLVKRQQPLVEVDPR
jgi:acetyl-CoA carboxylase biotin carboxyl carrier protein